MTTALRQLLASTAYRLQKSVQEAEEDFGTFDCGKGVRTPLQIMNHMTHVLRHAKGFYTKETVMRPDPLPFHHEVKRFHDELAELDDWTTRVSLSEPEYLKMIQGPLSDVLTHVGQLSMLRRLYGSPVKGEDFTKAAIYIGLVGENQTLSSDFF